MEIVKSHLPSLPEKSVTRSTYLNKRGAGGEFCKILDYNLDNF